MSRIPEDVLESIRQAVDIVDVVGRYVSLKRAGKTHKGRCPFHDEKTPSFYVWRETSTWKCFGCGESGNVFSFVERHERIPFPEAVRRLAREAGIQVEPESPEAAAAAARAQRLRDVNEWACRTFQAELRGPRGAAARAYLKRRGIEGATALTFRLGYAPRGWDNLLRAAESGGFGIDDLVDAGLAVRREADDEGHDGAARAAETRVWDRFRDRVIFPICDGQGRVIAFGARTLGNDEPKYLNSPETELFKKGRHLYALHLARDAMRKTGEGAVMEGYTDVIMAHQAGWPVAVAGLGTALTHDQAQLLSTHVKRLWLVYDGDDAGRRAAERAIPEFLPQRIETRVALLPPGKDPADLVAEGGSAALRAAIEPGREAFEHLVDGCRARHDVASVPGLAAATEDVLAALVGVRDDIRRALYVRHTADAFGVPAEVLDARLRELAARQAARAQRGASAPRAPAQPARAQRTPPSRLSGGAGAVSDEPPLAAYEALAVGADDEPQAAVAARPSRPAAPESPAAAAPPSRPLPPVERELLQALLGCPALLAEVPELGVELLTHPDAVEIVAALLGAADASGGALDDPLAALPPDPPELRRLAAALLASAPGKNLELQGRDCLRRLVKEHEDRRVLEQLARADSGNEEWQALGAQIAQRMARERRERGPG